MRTLLKLLVCVSLCAVAIADEGQLYNQVGTVEGQVTINNHPQLGRTPCSNNCDFILQFSKCKDALVYVHPDREGHYKVRIGIGRWRLVMRGVPPEFSGENSPDMLAPNQPRYIDVKSPLGEQHFDVLVHLPKQ